MSTHNLKLPETLRGMQVLDKSQFNCEVEIPILNIGDAYVSQVIPHVKKYCLKMRHIKPLQCTKSNKYILLNPTIQNWSNIESVDRNALLQLSLNETNFSTTKLKVCYENYHAVEVFKAILPKEQDGFSSFSQIGHIIHLNLREHLIPYKKIIGQVLLDKIPNARSVINKIDMIDNTYRNFEMEKLCGDDDMMVSIKENNYVFEFDFSKVYWNPRLSTEHERIAKDLSSGDILFDVFAGVGPFSIPAAKRGCIVYANDLNPDCFKWLNHNKMKNKIKDVNLHTYNKDGLEFIKEDLKDNLIKYINKSNITIVMNLPAMAVEFLKGFYKLYTEKELGNVTIPPVVHVYCFAKGENFMEITRKLVNDNMGFNIEDKMLNIFRVRSVSNFKEMMRVTIKLDKDILIGCDGGKRKNDTYELNACKKSCHGEEQEETNQERNQDCWSKKH
ncbi:hypothetical protein FQA39_LY13661 [Lamprigera yunnana]|nr:hypothetical protein FQA39_LY13661 [Lamprigera yunnana]